MNTIIAVLLLPFLGLWWVVTEIRVIPFRLKTASVQLGDSEAVVIQKMKPFAPDHYQDTIEWRADVSEKFHDDSVLRVHFDAAGKVVKVYRHRWSF